MIFIIFVMRLAIIQYCALLSAAFFCYQSKKIVLSAAAAVLPRGASFSAFIPPIYKITNTNYN
jgi:hypothetical protein